MSVLEKKKCYRHWCARAHVFPTLHSPHTWSDSLKLAMVGGIYTVESGKYYQPGISLPSAKSFNVFLHHQLQGAWKEPGILAFGFDFTEKS